uniref:low molecular weight phosphotyrosine protein phosphatase n=1 Tax=Myxine glutinosa TaxID=7769 RepID=UPI00358DF17A
MSALVQEREVMGDPKRSVLFVCLGNICRSPIAEAIYCKLLDDRGISHKWVVDSAATSTYEIGSRPDYRGLACMKRHGLSSHHIARQVTKRDFETFEFIFGMDESNMKELSRKAKIAPQSHAKLALLGSYDPQRQHIIHDPYHGEDADFESVFEQCQRCCTAFLDSL